MARKLSEEQKAAMAAGKKAAAAKKKAEAEKNGGTLNVRKEKVSREDILAALTQDPTIMEALKESLGGKEVTHVHVSENSSMIDSTEIPSDDLLDEPVVFCAWTAGYIDMGYTRKGSPVNPPYNRPIVFKAVTPEITSDYMGKRQMLMQCQAIIWSKKQVAYLRKHPLYDQTFFEDLSELKKQNPRSLNFNLKATMEVSKLNDKQVIEVCRGRNIPVSNDFDNMRKTLAKSLSAEAQGKQVQFQKEIAERQNKELLGKK